jgi:hypothetical protein
MFVRRPRRLEINLPLAAPSDPYDPGATSELTRLRSLSGIILFDATAAQPIRIARQNQLPTMERHLFFVTALGVCFFASITAAYAQVRADTGSIAIGGSVTGSTVIIGIPQEKVDELVRDAKRTC